MVRGERPNFQSEIEKFKCTFQKLLAPHCMSGHYTLKFHLLYKVLEDLQRFGSLSTTDPALLKHYKVLIKQSC